MFTGKEESVKHLINKQLDEFGVKCCVPKRQVPEKRNGLFISTIKPMFPGYVFIQAALDTYLYFKIMEIPYTFKFLHYTNMKDLKTRGDMTFSFKHIPEDEMEVVLGMLNENETLECTKVLIRGNKPIILSGPLKGKESKIIKIDKRKQRAQLQIPIFGETKTIHFGIELIKPSIMKNKMMLWKSNGGGLMGIRDIIERMINEVLEGPTDRILDNDLSSNGINSLLLIKILVNIEEEFGFEFEEGDLTLEKFHTIDDLVDYVTVVRK